MGGTSKQFIFLVVLGLRCCSKAFGERGLSFAAVHRLLTAMAAPATECRLQAEGLSRCGAQAVAAPRQMESSQTRDRAHVPCISRLIRILCTTPGKSESKHFSEDSGGPHKWDWTNCQWTVVLALEHKYPNASQHLFSTMAYNFFLYDLLLPTQLTFPFSFFPSWLLW